MAQVIPPISLTHIFLLSPISPPRTRPTLPPPSLPVAPDLRRLPIFIINLHQTSLPSDSGAAPSVEDIQDRLPSICVDYLSHDWSEEDVWASWRNMTRHKHEIANGVRLENASWRTWNKQRNKLKTISPETLNWLKDSDVTWLYGPLHTANVEPVRPLKVSSTDDRLGIDRPNPDAKKPILKHRTLSEMLTIASPSSPGHEGSDGDHAQPSDDEDRPKLLLQTKSDTNILRNRSAVLARQKSPDRHHNHNFDKSPSDENGPTSPTDSQQNSSKRHISFNTFVEQCIAVSDPTENQQHHQQQQSQSNSPSDSDDEMLEIKPSSLSSSSRSSRESRPSLSRNSSTGSSEHLTIAMIAPTMLKTGPGHNPDLPCVYAPPSEYQSPSDDRTDSYDFPSPQIDPSTGKWQEEDEDESGRDSGPYDYFHGPNLGGSEQKKGQAIPNNSGPYGNGRPPSGSPPSKYRIAVDQERNDASPAPSSNPSANVGSVTSPPQRGILKVRPPGQVPPPEPASPPLAYFNYTPSAATGIGGMRGTSPYDQAGPTGSPVTSPGAEERGRGRTPSRERLHDRSSSRGTSTSSLSSSSSRSPTENTAGGVSLRKVQTPPQLDRVQEESHNSAGGDQTPRKGDGVKPKGIDLPEAQPVEPGSPSLATPAEPDEKLKDYVADRSSTPTPHSSPQITFRPLKDTSPASLPHTSTHNKARSPDLPKADPPTSVPSADKSNNSGARATIAHVGTNAQPTLSQPIEDDDGASIMGRAANIASTAKDLLGSLWYGQNEGQGQGQGLGQHPYQQQTQPLPGAQVHGGNARRRAGSS
ncbi:hypothetical protein L198_03849 [Cryptococcus wingfieldii CBS 7118]|uniref:Nitrogen regulatory protein areA GATA-like domain-containing protein n=1 Tax=Cryptococcus wingfieldii CBS 7118 TaxID=1295528 RepID=A0A1E3JAZ4_9TREE|nr:hypothetical protein L198_03849 [Cryptococcus wingfieldii CBS 7118]ODN97286.1 hypothetical protein L198_03849 [Cryptococcus wingfieldii CBS 7118]